MQSHLCEISSGFPSLKLLKLVRFLTELFKTNNSGRYIGPRCNLASLALLNANLMKSIMFVNAFVI